METFRRQNENFRPRLARIGPINCDYYKANLLGFGLSIPKAFHSRRNFQIPCTAAHTPSAAAAALRPSLLRPPPPLQRPPPSRPRLPLLLHSKSSSTPFSIQVELLCLCCLLQVELFCISGTNKLSAPCTLFDLCSSMYILRSAY